MYSCITPSSVSLFVLVVLVHHCSLVHILIPWPSAPADHSHSHTSSHSAFTLRLALTSSSPHPRPHVPCTRLLSRVSVRASFVRPFTIPSSHCRVHTRASRAHISSVPIRVHTSRARVSASLPVFSSHICDAVFRLADFAVFFLRGALLTPRRPSSVSPPSSVRANNAASCVFVK